MILDKDSHVSIQFSPDGRYLSILSEGSFSMNNVVRPNPLEIYDLHLESSMSLVKSIPCKNTFMIGGDSERPGKVVKVDP